MGLSSADRQGQLFLPVVKPNALVILGQHPGPESCPVCKLLVSLDGWSTQFLGGLRWPFPAQMCHTALLPLPPHALPGLQAQES